MVAGERRIARYHDVEIPLDELAALCRRFHVSELALFGSVLRDDFQGDSDIDMLVMFEPGTRVSMFTLVDVQDAIEQLVQRRVDLVPKDGLKRLIRDHVIESSEVLYAA